MATDHLKKYQFKKGHSSAPAAGGMKARGMNGASPKGMPTASSPGMKRPSLSDARAVSRKAPDAVIQVVAVPVKKTAGPKSGGMKASPARKGSDHGVKFNHKPVASKMDRLGKR
jgi:hypothetical protein